MKYHLCKYISKHLIFIYFKYTSYTYMFSFVLLFAFQVITTYKLNLYLKTIFNHPIILFASSTIVNQGSSREIYFKGVKGHICKNNTSFFL